mmetsp:Transcript_2431/g.8141  ORF Transcript_2431/g.8141 Transcript_2431/m.8141 type:complete len:290 (+) Transcript_2431:998-1867(+)
MDLHGALLPADGQGLLQHGHHLPVVLVRPAAVGRRAGPAGAPRPLPRGQAAICGAAVGRRSCHPVIAAGRGRDPSEDARGVQRAGSQLLVAAEEHVPARRHGHVHLGYGSGCRGGVVPICALLPVAPHADPRLPDPLEEHAGSDAGADVPDHRQHRFYWQRADADQPFGDSVVLGALLGGRTQATPRRPHAAHRQAAGRENAQGAAGAVRQDRGRTLRVGVGHHVCWQGEGDGHRRAGLPLGRGIAGGGPLLAFNDRARPPYHRRQHEDSSRPRAGCSTGHHARGRLAV